MRVTSSGLFLLDTILVNGVTGKVDILKGIKFFLKEKGSAAARFLYFS